MKRFRRFKSDFKNDEKIILRDFLAMERTTLANERTFFSYIRTSFYLIVAAIAFVKLEDFNPLSWVGYAMFAISAFLLVFGIYRYQLLQKKLNRFYDDSEIEKTTRTDKNKE
jgi:putative membrane protein